MPPAPFVYAPNQLHAAQHYGPICPQRFPVDFSHAQVEFLQQLMSQLVESAAANSTPTPTTPLEMQLSLMQKLLPDDLFDHNKHLVETLSRFEQSEDCLNLNIYAPEEGKFALSLSLSAETSWELLQVFPRRCAVCSVCECMCVC